MFGRIRLFGAWTALAAAGALTAVDAAPELTLAEAVRLAEQGNRRLAIAAAGIGAAEGALDEARAHRLPRIDLEAAASRTTNPVLVFSHKLGQEVFAASDFDPAALNEPDAFDNIHSALTVSYPLYAGGRTRATIDAAAGERDAVTLQRDRTRQDVVREVIEAYSNGVLAEARLVVAREALETARANLKIVSDLRDAGLVVESDRLQARMRESELDEQVLRAESDVAVAHAAINFTLGRDLDTPFSLPETLDPGEASDEALEPLIATARRGRPDLDAAGARVTSAKSAVRSATSGYLPQIGLAGRYEANAGDVGGPGGTNWSVFLSARVAVFDGGGTAGRRRQARARLQQAEQFQELLRDAVALETTRAWHELRAARKSLHRSRDAVRLADETLRIVRDRYGEGLATVVELLEAETARTDARTREVANLRAVLLSESALNLAVGRL